MQQTLRKTDSWYLTQECESWQQTFRCHKCGSVTKSHGGGKKNRTLAQGLKCNNLHVNIMQALEIILIRKTKVRDYLEKARQFYELLNQWKKTQMCSFDEDFESWQVRHIFETFTSTVYYLSLLFAFKYLFSTPPAVVFILPF